MTRDLQRLFKYDAFADALEVGLTSPAAKAVRQRLVIEMVAQLHDSLTDSLQSEAEVYDTFVRTVSMLTAFLPEGRRR